MEPGAREYILTTERIGFRNWTQSDLPLAVELWADEQVTKLIGGPFTEEKVKERLATEISNVKNFGVQYWPIFLLSSGEHLGCCGLRPRHSMTSLELGFHLKPKYWGNGYALEAARAVVQYAFCVFAPTTSVLFAGHHPANNASRRLLQKLGFQYVCDEYYAPTGLKHPSYTFTLHQWRETAKTALPE